MKVFMRLPHLTTACFALLAGFAPAGLAGSTTTTTESTIAKTWDNLTFRIEDSSCFVGIAPVYLSVSELRPEGRFLTGTYEIRVPLKKSKNSSGRIVLPLDVTVQELRENGGTLRGKAVSRKKNKKPNAVVCEIHPQKEQLIRLAITTPDRTINFKSRYQVVEPDPEDG